MTTTKTMTCPRCDGKGHFREFAVIANGVCFRCAGAKVVSYRVARVNKFSQVNAMHCKTAAEARVFRLAEIDHRFPGVLETLTAEAIQMLGGGGSIGRWIVETK